MILMHAHFKITELKYYLLIPKELIGRGLFDYMQVLLLFRLRSKLLRSRIARFEGSHTCFWKNYH